MCQCTHVAAVTYFFHLKEVQNSKLGYSTRTENGCSVGKHKKGEREKRGNWKRLASQIGGELFESTSISV